jgi:hypothetical protein
MPTPENTEEFAKFINDAFYPGMWQMKGVQSEN